MSSLFSNRGDIINSTATTNNQIQRLEYQGQITPDSKLAKILTEKQQQKITSESSSLTTFTNHHCGPFVIFLANALANDSLTIGQQENSTNLTILQNDNPIRNLNEEQSDQLGKTIRQNLLNKTSIDASNLLPALVSERLPSSG